MSTIEHIVMGRVRRIHLLRQFMHPTLLKVYSGAVLFLTLNSMVSLANIFANIPPITTPVQVVQFATTALMHTEAFVQFVVVGIGVVCVLLVKDILHNTKQKSLFAQA